MRVPTRLHGMLDVAIGLALVVLPWLLGLGLAGAAGWSLTAAGVVVLLNTFVTDFERGLIRLLPIPLHLWLDAIVGLLLVLSPWLLAFDQTARAPHLIGGLVLIGTAFFTDTVPGYDRRRASAPAAE